MTAAFDIRDLPARFEEMLALAESGREVILSDGSVPRARLLPLAPRPSRVPGLHPGALLTTHDFDAPLPDEFWAGTP